MYLNGITVALPPVLSCALSAILEAYGWGIIIMASELLW